MAALGVTLLLVGLVLLGIVVPRLAHGAFAAGRFAAAARWYRWISWTALSRERRIAAAISVAAAYLGAGELARAEAELARFEPAALGPATRAAWLNNRAYARLRGGGEPLAALAWAEEAIGLRPDVPGLAHTFALGLLAVGRVDEAIAALDAIWQAGGHPPRLEAERCWDLGRAWEAKGQPEYAAEYRARSRSLCPDAPWLADIPAGRAARAG